MTKFFFISCLLILVSCNSISLNNQKNNPVPVIIVENNKKDTAKDMHIFRAMGAGQNQYILKDVGQPAATIQYLFVSAKPFNDPNNYEIDLMLNDETGQTIFTTPLPFTNETFSMPVQFFVKQNEQLVLKSNTDRFTFWAEGIK